MNYTLLSEEQAKQVRQTFEAAFIETPEEYAVSSAKRREEYFAENPNAHVYPIPNYNEVIYWSKIKSYKEIAFADVLSFLSKIGNPVYFMSDLELEGYVGMHLLQDNKASIGFVAETDNPKEFADFIYYEWRRFNDMNDFYFDSVLPQDLYVFDESFSWMLVFTHHNRDDFSSEHVENSFNRLCFLLRA